MLDLTIQQIDGAPRVRDLDLAAALEFERPRDIRKLIDRCKGDLALFGRCATVARRPANGGPAYVEYWLNEKQALFLCTKSEARRAVEITIQMVEMFVAWRNGSLPAAPAHSIDLPIDAADWLALVREIRLTHGRLAARRIWAKTPLPPINHAATIPPDGQTQAFESVRRFVDTHCEITGNKGDFIRSNRLTAAYYRWALSCQAPDFGPRVVANAWRKLADVYQDPETGARFKPVKRSNSGYAGLRLA